MTINEANVKAAKLWAAAEGRSVGKDANGKDIRPTREQRTRAQIAFAESVAAGELPVAILPAVRRTLTTVFESVPRVTDQFTRRETVLALDVDEQINVLSFGDQSNIPGINAGDTFVNGGLPTLLPREKYPQIGFTASGKVKRARKIGEAFGLDWEAIVRSRGAQVNLVREAFTAFGRHAANQEEIDVFKLLVKSTGFATAAGEGLNGAVAMPGNPDLYDPEDFAAAIAAANAVQLTVGTGGTTQTIPVNYTDFVVLTTPENAPRIRQASQARRVRRIPARTGTDSAVGGTEYEETIDFGGTITIVGSAWLKKIWPGIGKGWILIPIAAADDLPILTSNFLEGYETPSVWIKDSNARTISGTTVNPLTDGDFDSDAVETKVRHAHGATSAWNNGIVYSTGANA